MSVSGVNNSNNNAGTYAAGAAVVGGGAAGAYGYFSRPFLKDGAPTDAFIKKMGESMKAELPPEALEFTQAIENESKALAETLEKTTSVQEYKNVYVDHLFRNVDDINITDFKAIQQGVFENLEAMGLKATPEVVESFKNAQSVDDLKNVMKGLLDKEFAGKSLDEIKNAAKAQAKELEKQMGKGIFDGFWDSNKKAFVNCEEGIGKAVKSAAKKIQLKTAGIYGGIAAAVLGLGTYLCCAGKKAPQVAPEQNIDTQA